MSGIVGSAGSHSGVIGLESNPNQPWVHCLGDGGTSTLSNSPVKITAWEVNKDRGSNFSNGVFTAPITGAYLLTFRSYVYDLTANDMVYCKITTSNRLYYHRAMQTAEYGAHPATEVVACEVMDMDANDTVEVGMYNNNAARGTQYESGQFMTMNVILLS